MRINSTIVFLDLLLIANKAEQKQSAEEFFTNLVTNDIKEHCSQKGCKTLILIEQQFYCFTTGSQASQKVQSIRLPGLGISKHA